jgi:hypothetical protein
MDTQNASDPQQRRDARVSRASLDLLVRGAREVRCEEDGLLGHVLAEPPDADAVADGAALMEQPGVVIGQAGHSTNALTKIIISQPCLSGII